MRIYSVVLFMLIAFVSFGQKYMAEQSLVSFYSHAAIEDIAGKNKNASSIFNTANNEIVFSIPVTDFVFDKSLMQEHFNEKYLETEKFPKSTFQGKITGFDMKASGVQEVKAQGKLVMHGVTRDVEISGTAQVKSKKIILKSKFIVVLEEYNIDRPQIVWQNIAEKIEVTVEFTYAEM